MVYYPYTLLCSFVVAAGPVLAAYTLVQEYSGENFFNGWTYKDGYDDTTHGAVNFLNQQAAQQENLTSFNGKNPIIKVDNAKNLPKFPPNDFADQQKRDSFFPLGSMFVIDLAHVPAGCSVWPGLWMLGKDWPHNGEIDIIESANLMSTNRMTLHTDPGCAQASGVKQLGTALQTDCSSGVDSNLGCTVQDNRTDSFGDAFNKANGGVWAVQSDTTGINIWFWSRKDVPVDLSSATDSVDPSDQWGTPAAAWPSSSCDIAKFFGEQQFAIDITLCGDFAGTPPVYNTSGCTTPSPMVTDNTCYLDWVETGSNYDEAYFEINYIRAFSLVNDTTSSPTGNTTTGDTAGGGSGNTGSAVRGPEAGMAALCAMAIANVAWALMMMWGHDWHVDWRLSDYHPGCLLLSLYIVLCSWSISHFDGNPMASTEALFAS
ncbi:concanavalin A-like lectin/glucanase domain-containing protein [Daedaleopsis nitida]|nr:concanavalin A-like lectin/glucanase domain-containing protein [Daedaleopsis nitida]